MSRKTDAYAINHGPSVVGDKAMLNPASNETVLPDYVMLDFVDDFVPTGEEAHAKRAMSDARSVPSA